MKILLVFTIFSFTLFLTPIVFAQTSNIELDSRNNYGEISVKNVKVIEREFYKVIVLNIQFQAKDLELENGVSIYPDSIKLVNENDKVYFPTRDECKIPGPIIKTPDGGPCYEVENECGKPVWRFSIKGIEGGIKSYHPCFRVEKEFDSFKVYYGYEEFGKSLSYDIGSIDVNKANHQTIQKTEKSSIDIISDAKNLDSIKPKDIFSQLIDIFRNLFTFS